MKIVLSFLIILLLVSACERTFESADLDIELPEEPPVPTGLKISHLLSGIELEWQIPDTAAVDYFNVYYTDSDEGDYLLWDTTSAFTLTIATLNSGQEYFFRIAAVSTEGAESNFSLAVSTVVGVVSMVINSDDFFTNSEQISLRFTIPSEPLTVKLSEDPLLGDAYWRGFSQPSSFTLSSGDGAKFVYAVFQFADGSESSEAVSDSIILDTRAMIDSTWFTADSTHLLAGDTVTFFVDAGESNGEASVSFPTVSNLDMYDDGTNGDITDADGIYSRSYVIPVDLEVNEGVVTANFTDAAGNSADNVTAPNLINIVIPIEPTSLWAVAESSSSIRLDWTEVVSNDFVSYRIYRDVVSGVDEASELVATITSRATVDYTDNALDDNQAYYYKVYAYGSQGLLISSPEATATTPAIEAITLWATAETSSSIRLDWTEVDTGDFVSYRIYRDIITGVDESSDLATVILSQSTVTYSDIALDASQPYYYKIYAYGSRGLLTSSPEMTATTLANFAPDSVSLALSLGDVEGLAIVLTWGQSEADDFESYQIYRGDNTSVTNITGQRIAVIHDQSQTSFTDHRTSVTDIYYYKIYIYDQQGLISLPSNWVLTP
jgi:fibronectin type 3 domain-containing protein